MHDKATGMNPMQAHHGSIRHHVAKELKEHAGHIQHAKKMHHMGHHKAK